MSPIVRLALVPVADVAVAFLLAGLVVAAVGIDPLHALRVLLEGALGNGAAIGYTLYYATNLVFTGLAVAVAFHGGLFNIGGEGQATMGGLGAGLMALSLDGVLPGVVLIPLALGAAALFGAGWAAIPGWLQARRGSHVVITTIMFNFIAAAIFVYLMVNVLIAPGSMSPESRAFARTATVPTLREVAALVGIALPASPLNLSVVLAAIAAVGVWFAVWRTRFGYELRVLGHSPGAARYAGIGVARMTVVAMAISGALAGMVAVNEILGVHHRLILNFTAGYGFGGIAVALMGRNHPVGIVLAALLVGVLYQGGAEMSFEIPELSRDMVSVIQGLVILVCGALAGFTAPAFRWLGRLGRREQPASTAGA